MKVKNILESLHDKIVEGKITYREAALELYLAGWFNYVPDDYQVGDLLKL